MKEIRKAVVIGSGVMGAGIAAHLANAGISCLLLDLVPKQLTGEEMAKGHTLQHPAVRNRLAVQALARLKKANPSPLYDPDFSELITPGNIEDHMDRITEADWIVEVIVENLEAKKQLLRKVEAYWKPGIVVSSNTSGISINAMAAECSETFKRHFLGAHFFNPPRYMKLLELIPSEHTDPDIIAGMKRFCEKRLGKGVVMAKDTPNFIANRIGTYGLLVTLREMREKGFSVEEVDAITGPALGRPQSATFRTLDLVGLDTFIHVANNVFEQTHDDAEKAVFDVPDALIEMVHRGWLGEKSGQGFYKKKKNPAGNEIWSLDVGSMEYRPQQKPGSPSLEAAKLAKSAGAKTKALLGGSDRYAELAWSIMKHVLIYSAEKLGEIAESIQEIDAAMKWGFNWELGPFETWDAIGLTASVQRMESEGLTVPAWVKDWISKGNTSFYEQRNNGLVSVHKGQWKLNEIQDEEILLKRLKEQNKVIRSNSGASLIDLGDGVACLEFHSPNNAIGNDILSMIQQSLEEVRRNYEGLVIANQGKNFCVGANLMLLLMEAQDEEWDEIDGIIRLFQTTMMKIKRFEKPVVAAPHRMTLGGGVEVCLAAGNIVAAAETYFGLVEAGAGLIPAGGGCKEMALRISGRHKYFDSDLQPDLNQIFETIGMAKVSTSGHEAMKLGLFKPTDRIVINQEQLLYEAKQTVLAQAKVGFEPAREEKIRVAGKDGKAVLQLGAYGLKEGGYISEHDMKIAKRLAHVLAGGDVPANSLVTEQYMLDLEREAFLSLIGEPKTQARMHHLLTKGKALRN